MIGIGKTISWLSESLSYADNVEKSAKKVYKNGLMGDDVKSLCNEFKMIHELNENCKRNMFSFVISPTIEDSKKLYLCDWEKICKLFLEELNLHTHQSVGYLHQDKEHLHIHLYASRISFNGKAASDSFIGRKSMNAAEAVAINLGLQTLPDVREQRQNVTKAIRKEILDLHNQVLISLVQVNIHDYILGMKRKGVQVKRSIDKLGNLRGYRIQYKDYDFKASEVHRQLSKNNLEKAFAKAQQLKSKNNDTIRKTGGLTR